MGQTTGLTGSAEYLNEAFLLSHKNTIAGMQTVWFCEQMKENIIY